MSIPLLPHYYSELFLLAFQLFPPQSEDYAVLQDAIREVEAMVLDEDELAGGISLYDIEMAIESNPDYYSFFARGDGSIVTKFDVERELNKVKAWIYGRVREQATGRKFQRFR
jgi:hypothetical protein